MRTTAARHCNMDSAITRNNELFLQWYENQSSIRKRLQDEGYRFDVDYNGEYLRQTFKVKLNNDEAVVWPSPCVWGKSTPCYWGVFIKADNGQVVGREFPYYNPEDTDAIAANVDTLFMGLAEAKAR